MILPSLTVESPLPLVGTEEPTQRLWSVSYVDRIQGPATRQGGVPSAHVASSVGADRERPRPGLAQARLRGKQSNWGFSPQQQTAYGGGQ